MPCVAEVAVAAAPDARRGEPAWAVVRVLPGRDAASLGDVRAHLDAAGLARQKWPEDLRMIDEMPRTASGKVKKFVLREDLRRET
jgi:acyl-CoA synthetase (AMP-forming)/AMP-acid ligase II